MYHCIDSKRQRKFREATSGRSNHFLLLRVVSSDHSSRDETLYFLLMLPEHVIQAIHRTPYKVSEALRGFLRAVDVPDQMVVCHKIKGMCSVPLGQRLPMLVKAMVGDRFQTVLGNEIDHACDPLGEIFFWTLQIRQLVASFVERGGLESVLTAVDE